MQKIRWQEQTLLARFPADPSYNMANSKQIEGALRTDADLIALLSELDWKQSNHEDWGVLQWP